MMRKFYSILALVLMVACDAKVETKNVKVKVDGNCQMVDLFERVEVVPLETVGDNLLGEMFNVIVDQNEYYLVDKAKSSVCRYSADGKFIAKIGNQGQAQNEYLQLVDCKVDSVVKIATLPNFRVVEYSKNGDYLRDTSLPFSGYSFVQNDSYDYIYLGLNSLDAKCLVRRIERDGGKTTDFYPITTQFSSSGNSFPEIQLMGDTVLFTHIFDNNVYQLVGDSVSVKHKFDLGRYAIADDFLAKSDIFAAFDEISEKGFSTILYYTENSSYAVAIFAIQTVEGVDNVFGLLNKSSNQWQWSKIDKEQALWNTTGIFLDQNSALYFVVAAEHLLEDKSVAPLLQNRSAMDSLTIDSNHVILKCALK